MRRAAVLPVGEGDRGEKRMHFQESERLALFIASLKFGVNFKSLSFQNLSRKGQKNCPDGNEVSACRFPDVQLTGLQSNSVICTGVFEISY